MDGLTVGTGSFVGQPDAMSEALDCQLKFTESGGNWWIASGASDEYYYDGDAAQSEYYLGNYEESCLQTIVESDSQETVKFYWKVSSHQGYDYLAFYIDGELRDQITGEVDWQQKSYSVTSGIHILKWRYYRGSGQPAGDNCGWVDFVQWTGPSPDQDPSNWQEISYKHDLAGRRIEKKVDGYSTRYVYDGDHVIAEYDGNNNLLRKYIYGPGIDQPVSMIEVADASATYYYHFDALGSVVALSDSSGDTVQTYEYSVYGEVAVEDANHTNPYMFAGVRYDIEIGLYYNRARYYNPFTGRFLQTDPIGYEAGMNLYAYCGNNPTDYTDPSGLMSVDMRMGGASLVTYILESDPCDVRYAEFSDGESFIEFLQGIADSNDKIVYFEIIAHGITAGDTTAYGFSLGGDTFGVGSSRGDEGEGRWYGLDDYSDLWANAFASDAKIEFEFCYGANEGGIGQAIANLLPSARVYGYTGNCKIIWPLRETRACWDWRHPTLISEWVRILPKSS